MKCMVVKTTIVCFLVIILGLSIPGPTYGQEDFVKFPTRPINFICPFPPGNTADLSARFISKAAEKYLGQPVVLLNKPGAGTTIGVAAIATAKPDGYTVGYSPPTAMFIAPFMEKLPYHPLKDFQQIMQYSEATFALFVKGDSPFKSFKSVIEFARKNPKKLSYGTTGAYGITHLTMLQIIKKEEGVQFNHIPFKGGTETGTALLGGHIDLGVGDFNAPLVEAGEIRLLALMGEKRIDDYPGVPTLKELGYDRPEVPPVSIYFNICGPKGIPEPIAKKLEQAFTQAAKDPVFTKGLKELRFQPVYRNSVEMTEHITYLYNFYGKVLKDMGIRKY